MLTAIMNTHRGLLAGPAVACLLLVAGCDTAGPASRVHLGSWYVGACA